jgi:hypothetical protein
MKAFISYTREKDSYDHVVSTFRDRLLNELKLRKRTSDLFMDKSLISAGANFSLAIDKALAESDVLIVLLSPAWLESEWCRRELERFVDFKSGQGRFPAVLPLLWVTVDLKAYPNDQLVSFLTPIQYRDWRNLRKKKWDSFALRDELDKLAEALFALAKSS